MCAQRPDFCNSLKARVSECNQGKTEAERLQGWGEEIRASSLFLIKENPVIKDLNTRVREGEVQAERYWRRQVQALSSGNSGKGIKSLTEFTLAVSL